MLVNILNNTPKIGAKGIQRVTKSSEFAIIGYSLHFPVEKFETHCFTLCRIQSSSKSNNLYFETFCDDWHGFLENYSDPIINWRQRMLYIGTHYAAGMDYNDFRPDYIIFDFMWWNTLLSFVNYNRAIKHTEKKYCDGLVAVSLKTKDSRKKVERSLEQRHSLDWERRQVRKKERWQERERERGLITCQTFRNQLWPNVLH
jgi:hypothetical protein